MPLDTWVLIQALAVALRMSASHPGGRTGKEEVMDDFDRQWVDLVGRVEWIEALYALIGLTQLGQRPTTVRQLAGALGRPEEEATELAWQGSRVRPENGRFHLETPWPGASPRRKLYVGDRGMAVSGCAPDLFGVAAVVDVPFRVEDVCSVTGVPIRIEFANGRTERVDPPETVAVMLPPREANQIDDMDIEQVNADLCVLQPFFSSAQAAQGWLDAHPGGRAFSVEEMANRPFVAYMRENWRPRILANLEKAA
jgi:alkylmercury lyase